jgi:ABC-type transport system involved in multi-copper enzyme maturation permease subunit
LGLGLLIVTYVAQQFTYGAPSRVALDFGMGVLSLSSVAIAIFMGVGLISKEIENRTVYMVISRPVRRSSFIVGRILGLNLILSLNIALLSALTLAVYFFTGGEFQPLILWTILFIILEASIMLLVVSFFSLVTSNTLSVILSIVVFFAGHAIKEAQLTTFAQNRPIVKWLLEAYHYALPAFSKINTRDLLIYNQDIEPSFYYQALSYSLVYGGFLVFLTLIIFERKNLD